jgi:hypothetical protein
MDGRPRVQIFEAHWKLHCCLLRTKSHLRAVAFRMPARSMAHDNKK